MFRNWVCSQAHEPAGHKTGIGTDRATDTYGEYEYEELWIEAIATVSCDHANDMTAASKAGTSARASIGTDTIMETLLLELAVVAAALEAPDDADRVEEAVEEAVVELAPALVPDAVLAAVRASVQVMLLPTLLSSVNTTSEHWYKCP